MSDDWNGGDGLIQGRQSAIDAQFAKRLSALESAVACPHERLNALEKKVTILSEMALDLREILNEIRAIMEGK